MTKEHGLHCRKICEAMLTGEQFVKRVETSIKVE
jgi:hypothetical protein